MAVPCHMLEWPEVIFSGKKIWPAWRSLPLLTDMWFLVRHHYSRTELQSYTLPAFTLCAVLRALIRFPHVSIEWVMNGAVLFIALQIRKQISGPEASQLVELINSVLKTNSAVSFNYKYGPHCPRSAGSCLRILPETWHYHFEIWS